jgi:DNA-directed RNA polymerase specialized sigma24 family protein
VTATLVAPARGGGTRAVALLCHHPCVPPGDATSDEELLRRARAAIAAGDDRGARRCAALLWHRHEARVRLRAAGKVGRGRVDDVVSALGERFTRFVYLETFTPDSFVALLLRMTDWVAVDVLRGEARRDVPSEELASVGTEDDELTALLDRDERDGLLAILDERERAVLLAGADGLPASEAAAHLDLSVANLYVIRHRARTKLRTAREEHGG